MSSDLASATRSHCHDAVPPTLDLLAGVGGSSTPDHSAPIGLSDEECCNRTGGVVARPRLDRFHARPRHSVIAAEVLDRDTLAICLYCHPGSTSERQDYESEK